MKTVPSQGNKKTDNSKSINIDKPLDELIKDKKKTKAKKRTEDSSFKKKKNQKNSKAKQAFNKKKGHFTKKETGPSFVHKQIILEGHRKSSKDREPKEFKSSTLKVSNVSSEAKMRDIKKLFQKFGYVKKLEPIVSENGKSLGAYNITYSSPKEAEKALKEYDDAELLGRVLCIKYVNS